jgi:hypothetical protein
VKHIEPYEAPNNGDDKKAAALIICLTETERITMRHENHGGVGIFKRATIFLAFLCTLVVLSVSPLTQCNTITLLGYYKTLGSFQNPHSNIETPPYVSKNNNITAHFQPVRKRILGETGSLEFLLETLANMTVFDEHIDLNQEEERCKRYGMKLSDPPLRTRRRIFRGNLIADDSWHSIAITAMEGFGIYEHVSFVESNRTHSYVPRGFRFSQGSDELKLLQSGMFGPNTEITMDYYIDENINEKEGQLYESIQRDSIMKSWKAMGMTREDIGLVADADESFSRDYLRAVQICDVPQLRPNQSCQHPKILAWALVFEGSPNCLVEERRWFHPDLMLGECVEGIGDEKKHPQVPRVYNGTRGHRQEGYEPDGANMKNVSFHPLWNGADYRETAGGEQKMGTRGENTGWHAHNFFMSRESLRFKYKTYSHPHGEAADTMDLGTMHEDLKLMVKCMLDLSDENDTLHRVREGVDGIDGPVPLAFRYKQYRDLRHAEMRRIIAEDERIMHKTEI